MKHILIIFIFASFLFSQVATVNYDNSIEQVEEVVKYDPATSSADPNNILTQDDTQLLEEVAKYDPAIKQK